MEIQGHWVSEGFVIRISPALWSSVADQAPVEYRLEIQSMNLLWIADGGDWEATFSLGLHSSDIELLYNNAIGKYVEIFDVDGVLWEGVINNLDASIGTFAGVVGRLLDVDNKVKAVYSALDTTDPSNIVGTREETDWYEDATSQGLYGIQERVMQIGGASEDEVPDIIQSYLSDVRYPETDERITVGQDAPISITIEAVGISQFFKKYTIVDTNTGTQNASDKIKSVLNAELNGIISSDQNGVQDNTLQVSRKENENRTAWQVLKGTFSKGDANFDRWIFGVTGGRKAYYNVVPSTIRYEHKISEPSQFISDQGREIKPWRVKPGYWLKIADFLVGQTSPINPSSPSELREDKRVMFIEEVRFRYPYNVSLRGNRISRLSQRLAQAGLAGVG